MSCTFFIKGILKKKYKVNDLFNVIIEEIKDTKWKYKLQSEEIFEISFNDRSEVMSFKFEDNKIDEICKIHFESNEEFNKLLEIFYNIKNMFYCIEIDDDFGLWNDYLASKNPCKIKLRELSKVEKDEIEEFDYKKYNSISIIFGIIAKDLSEKMNKKISSIQEIVDNIDPKLNKIFFLEMFKKEILCFFCWIYETMEYKNYGKVKELDIETTRGLGSNFFTFCCAIDEAVFGIYGGNTGPKHSQIVKLYYEIERKNPNIENDAFLMYRYILSTLEYSGFKKVIY